MRPSIFRIARHSLVALTLLAPLSAMAAPVSFTVEMTAPSEVPPNTSTGKATANLTFDKATKILTWSVTYSGLTGPATAAHFHGPAVAGANAGVAIPLAAAGTSPITGQATLTDAQEADFLAGKWYMNVHTAAHPGGEIRGQVTPPA